MAGESARDDGATWKDPDDGSMLVMFSTRLRTSAPLDDYRTDAGRMVERLRESPGFVSMKRFTADDGESITVARFASDAALEQWRRDAEHAEVQARGRTEYYDSYWVHVARTVRRYGWERLPDGAARTE